jgi:putative hydrolase of the HAD superfamily
MDTSPTIRLIVSDFGGVICTYDYRIFCRRLASRTGRSAEEIYELVYTGDLHGAFESGRLTGPTFYRGLMERLGADVPYDEFFQMYGDIFTEIAGTCDLLRRLHTRYPLYLLSDTNEIHFGYVKKTVDIVGLFRECVVSYEVGVMKPDPRIYAEVLRRSGLPAGACVFVDDRAPNVEGARRVGMHAILFQSPDQVAVELIRLGVQIP